MFRKTRNKKSSSLLRWTLISSGILLLLAAMLMNSVPEQVSAAPGDLSSAVAKYPGISGTMLQQCSLCHTSAIPSLNPYGAAYKAAGRNSAAFGLIENMDSDGDGFTNLQEINSLTFPGDSTSFPVVPTATKTPIPPTATSVPPTSTGISPTATSISPSATLVSVPFQISAQLTCPGSAVIGTTFTCTLSVNPAGTSLSGLQINLIGLNGLLEYTGAQFTSLGGVSPISLSNVSNTFVWAGSNGYMITNSGDLATLSFRAVRSGAVNLSSQTKGANGANAPIAVGINSVAITISPTVTTETPKTKISGKGTLSSGINPSRASDSLLNVSSQTVASTQLNSDGTYTLEAPAGTYTFRISAPGYLSAQKSVTLVLGTTLSIPDVSLFAGDINGDNKIDSLDLISLGGAFEISPAPLASDLNGDSVVNLFDLTLLAKNWRKSGYDNW